MVKKLYTVTDPVAGFIASVPGYPIHSFKLFTENGDVPFLCVYCMLKTQRDEIASLRSTITEMQYTITTLKKN